MTVGASNERESASRVECPVTASGSRRARSSGPNASGSSSANGRGPNGWSISSRGPPCSSSTCRHRPHGISTRRRRPHTTGRSACRRRRNAGRRPLHTRHRDQGHMRHSPHCSRRPSGGRRPAPPRRPETPNTARMPLLAPRCLVPQHLPVICGVTSAPADPGSECIPKPPSRGSTRDVGNPNFRGQRRCERLHASLWLLQMGLESPEVRASAEPERPPMALEAR